MRTARIIGVALLCAWSAAAAATTISYDLVSLGGPNWRYEVTVSNDTLPGPIDEFTFFFPSSDITDLSTAGQPPGFDPLVFPPNPVFFPDWAVDYLASGPGIAVGASLGTFLIDVVVAGTNRPGSFDFEIVDPDTFQTVDSGRAIASGAPEPATVVLVALGLLAMTSTRRRR